MVYEIGALVTISITTTVEADSYEEAIEIAEGRQMMSILPNNGETEDEYWMAYELDGEPHHFDCINHDGE